MSHGHVKPNADGSKARCGGPKMCSVCALELSASELQANQDMKSNDAYLNWLISEVNTAEIQATIAYQASEVARVNEVQQSDEDVYKVYSTEARLQALKSCLNKYRGEL